MAARKKAVAKRSSTDIADLQAKIAEEAAAMGNSLGSQGGNRIRVTQGKQFVDPDGNKTDGPIHVVVLDFSSQNMYYPGAYDEKNIVPPDCFALGEPASVGGANNDKLVPSNNAPEKQSDDCATCLMNQFQSDSRGRGKACKNQKLLVVVSPDEDDPSTAPLRVMTVSPSALKRWDAHVRTLRAKQLTPVSVITKVSIDPNSDYPTIMFDLDAVNPYLAEHYARRTEAHELLKQEPSLTGTDAGSDAKPRPAARRKKAARRTA